MEDLIQVIETFLANLDSQNYNGFVEEESQFSHVDFTITAYNYETHSANITNLTVLDFDSDSQIAEFEVSVAFTINTLFEGDDYSEASHDNEDDKWYNVKNISEEHKYEVNSDLIVSLDLGNNIFNVITSSSDIHININIKNFIEE